MKLASLAFALCIPCLADTAMAVAIRVPLSQSSGIALGQGFDIETMQWRNTCVTGREVVASPADAAIDMVNDFDAVDTIEKVNGSLAGGVSVLGGLAQVEAENTYLSAWDSTDLSTSSLFRLNLGTGTWSLKNLRPTLPLQPEARFRKACGTHVAVTLETTPEIWFSIKYLSRSTSWLEKITWEMTASAAWGLAKKKWTEEHVTEAVTASASLQVGVFTRGWFSRYFASRFGSNGQTTKTCRYPDIQECQKMHVYFTEIMQSAQQQLQDPTYIDSGVMDQTLATVAVLIPYDEAGPLFKELSPSIFAVRKVLSLNELSRKLYKMQAQNNDSAALGVSAREMRGLTSEINQLNQKLHQCAGKNLCN